MNFFGGGQQEPQGPDPIFAAKTELEMYTNLFNQISASCFQKCASRKHKDEELSLGEMTCTGTFITKCPGIERFSTGTYLDAGIEQTRIFCLFVCLFVCCALISIQRAVSHYSTSWRAI